ncbi:DUF3800 domain-containing protein [Xanthomonas campestris pv. campestris]|nr:DUF3800 domain-containing protein [Xanthomonas campestris pv. campestris]
MVQAEGEPATPPLLAAADPRYSNYIVYVDESGDHGLESVDPRYPVFVLAFCVFHKGHYAQRVVPAIESFKFRHFGHDVVILHEHDIRKKKGHFRFSDRLEKTIFLDELTGIIELHNFILCHRQDTAEGKSPDRRQPLPPGACILPGNTFRTDARKEAGRCCNARGG